jgi:H+/Cl- antiporter ClcA
MFWLLLGILAALVGIFFMTDYHLTRIRRNQRRWLPRPGTVVQEDEW